MTDMVKLAGYIGLLGAVLVGAGEFTLQYSPNADYAHGYTYFAHISKARLSLGHYVSVLAAPLYIIGYWHLAKRLDPKNTWLGKFFFLIGAYAFIIGAVWMGQRVFLALTVQEITAGVNVQNLLSAFSAHNEPLVNIVRVVMLILSIMWVFQILKGRANYPKYMALFSPAFILAVIFGLYMALPKLGGLLIPNAMNVTHIIIFSMSLWSGRKLSAAG